MASKAFTRVYEIALIFAVLSKGSSYWSTNGVQNPIPVIELNAPGYVNTEPLANTPFLGHFSNALVRDAD